jgi:uncharacterized protein YbcI
MDTPGDGLKAGRLHAALANEIGRLMAEASGRGATRSRAFIEQDVVVCLLEECATKAERTLIAAGKQELVRVQRDALQRAMEKPLVACVERLTGRAVLSYLSGSTTLGESLAEIFVLEPSNPG